MRQHGFTLIELMVSTVILSLLLSVAMPSLINISDQHYSNSSVSQFRKVLTSARALALNSNKKITICPNIRGICNNNWQNPLSVFLDTNNNEIIDAGETLFLTASNENTRGNWLNRNTNTTSIKFNEQGHAFGSATPASRKNQYARQLVISFQGRIRSDYYLSSRGTPYARLGGFNCPP